MSTTVSYKGQTLTTVSNGTKTLLTEGKYLEDDLTLTDVSGGGAVLTTKNISANGTYNASSDSADGYSQVNVAVPNTYTNADEGKVVSDGALVAQTSKNINSNGTHSTVTNNQVVVAVPNSYSQSDEGKVVSNGALVAQTSDTVTANDTYDTTLINSLTVNVSGGGDFEGVVDGTGTTLSSNITSLAPNVFRNNTVIKSVSLPLVTKIESEAFRGCSNLEYISFPSATRIGGNAFMNCNKLTDPLAFPLLDFVSNSGFSNIANVPTIDIYPHENINQYGFSGASSLTTLILRKASVVPIGGTTIFNNTPFASGGAGGTIYIPKALYDHLGDGSSYDYKAATNWSTLDGYGTITWAAIEGSYYETHYADGTPISA